MIKLLTIISVLLCISVNAPKIEKKVILILPQGQKERYFDRYLYDRCEYYNLDFWIMRGVALGESDGFANCIEWKKDKKGNYILDRHGKRIEISYSIMQVSIDTCRDYEWKTGKKLCGNTWREKAFNWRNSIEAVCWQARRSLNRTGGNYGIALSEHNMGATGFWEWKKKTGNRYNYEYVFWVEYKGQVKILIKFKCTKCKRKYMDIIKNDKCPYCKNKGIEIKE